MTGQLVGILKKGRAEHAEKQLNGLRIKLGFYYLLYVQPKADPTLENEN